MKKVFLIFFLLFQILYIHYYSFSFCIVYMLNLHKPAQLR